MTSFFFSTAQYRATPRSATGSVLMISARLTIKPSASTSFECLAGWGAAAGIDDNGKRAITPATNDNRFIAVPPESNESTILRLMGRTGKRYAVQVILR